MGKFNETKPSNKTVNLAGGFAYKRGAEEELVFAVVSSFLEDKFYESGEERIERIKSLITQNKPEFVAKLAIMARTEFYLRSVSHLLVAELSKIHRGDSLVMKAVQKIALRPDDLVEIVAYLKGKLPKQVKRGIRRALQSYTRYQLAKYRMEGRKIKLIDLFNLVHPNPKYAKDANAWKDLVEGKLRNVDTWETQKSAGKTFRELVLEGKIGYMALLRNLRNIDGEGDSVVIEKACQTISDKEQVKNSKQLPFRFYTAYQNVSNQDMLRAISTAMEYSLDNVPKLKGKTLIGIDCSGSMEGKPIEIASIFAGALMKKNNTDVILYSEDVKEYKYLDMPILKISEEIQDKAQMGGTNTSLVFEYALSKPYDRIVILSDNESWQEGYYGNSTNKIYKRYVAKGNDPFIYAIDIQGYGTKDVKGEKVFHLSGWSEKLFDFMKWVEKGDMVKEINNIEL